MIMKLLKYLFILILTLVSSILISSVPVAASGFEIVNTGDVTVAAALITAGIAGIIGLKLRKKSK